jgi:hypothetical protein
MGDVNKKKAWEEAKASVGRDYPDIEENSDKWSQLCMLAYKKSLGGVSGVVKEQRSLRDTLLLRESSEFGILRRIYEAKNAKL